ncbi:MAG: undecaprenyldiphospho-muramoylpentapeptide beta-N-acetylglucosaminyltransferase [Sandaracinaceae bacterium]|nr:undecaprenyldiphospho-muramoylpentapeptide beta-N-acetylglucosaminyltransferase [Sandaracinaceae bacterium]
MPLKLLVAGGGTGGHLYPAISIVHALRACLPSIEVLFVGSPRGLEARLLPPLGERLILIDVAPIKGQALKALFKSLSRLPLAALQALSLLRRERPDLVLGLGGYASGPLVALHALFGGRSAIVEPNLTPGFTNRLLGPLVGRAYLAFEETAVFFGSKARVFGTPLRPSIVAWAKRAHADPQRLESEARHILVLGGSRGAQRLNEIVPEAIALLPEPLRRLPIVHQSGVEMAQRVEAAYRSQGLSAQVFPFIEDPAPWIAQAIVVIARAGASTLAELCAIGRPSILIPYPHAADDHQRHNAIRLHSKGAAIHLPQSELTPFSLCAHLRCLLESPNKRFEMAGAMRRLGRPDAAFRIAKDIMELVGVHLHHHPPSFGFH